MVQMRKVKNDWRELWWAMANGIKSEYDRIAATDVMEFWAIYDIWLDIIKKKNQK